MNDDAGGHLPREGGASAERFFGHEVDDADQHHSGAMARAALSARLWSTIWTTDTKARRNVGNKCRFGMATFWRSSSMVVVSVIFDPSKTAPLTYALPPRTFVWCLLLPERVFVD